LCERESLSSWPALGQTLNLVIYFGVSIQIASRPSTADGVRVRTHQSGWLRVISSTRPSLRSCLPALAGVFFTVRFTTTQPPVLRRIRVNSNHVYANRPARVVLLYRCRLTDRPFVLKKQYRHNFLIFVVQDYNIKLRYSF